MKLISEVVKKVESEKISKIPETVESLTPIKKKKRFFSLVLFLGAFLILAGGGYFIWNSQFRNPAPKVSSPRRNLGERLKQKKSKSLSQGKSTQIVTQRDSADIHSKVAEKKDFPVSPSLVPAQNAQIEKKRGAKTEKPLTPSASLQAIEEKDSTAQVSTEKKADSGEILSSASSPDVQVQKKLLTEEKIAPLIQKPPLPERVERKALAKKPDKKPNDSQFSKPEKLVLSNPLTKIESDSKNLTSVKEKNQLAKNYFDFGVKSQRTGKLQEAEECYLKAIALDSNFYQARFNLSTVYLEKGRLSDAEKELNSLSNQRAEDPKLLYNSALLYNQKKEFVKAEEHLNRLLLLDPENYKAYLLKGKNLESQNRVGEALNAYIQAYQISPAEPKVLYLLARGFDLAGRKNEALTYYNLYLGSSPVEDQGLIRSIKERINFLKSGGEND